MELKTNPEEVFQNINNLENWKQWAEWQMNVPESEFKYSRQTIGKGALMEFDLPKQGKGEIEIIESQENTFIKTRTFFNNWDGTTYSEYSIKSKPGGGSIVELKVSNSENINFFMRGILFMNNSSEKVYENTLLGLKNLDELSQKY